MPTEMTPEQKEAQRQRLLAARRIVDAVSEGHAQGLSGKKIMRKAEKAAK